MAHTKETLQNKINALGLSELVKLSDPFVRGTVEVVVEVENYGTFSARSFELAEAYILGFFGGQSLGKNFVSVSEINITNNFS